MHMMDLKLSVLFTLAFIIGITTLAFTIILDFLGLASPLAILFLAIAFNVGQWLVSPYLIQIFYGVRELEYSEAPQLHEAFDRLVSKAGLRRKPKLMVAELPYPNAFAYGSPLTGNRVAVTRGLLDTLSLDEIEAVLGHELGHLVHRDVQIMTFASVLPAFFYLLSRLTFFSSLSERDRGDASIAIGIVSLVLYFILSLATLHLSRLREYYADSFSVKLAPNPSIGAKRLMSALAKIVSSMGAMKARGANLKVMGFKELFIADPDSALRDYENLEGYVAARRIMSRRLTLADKITELFSTHPNIVERLRFLDQIARTGQIP